MLCKNKTDTLDSDGIKITKHICETNLTDLLRKN